MTESMPGMLDTVLNLGRGDAWVLGLAERTGDERFAWDSYPRFVVKGALSTTSRSGSPAA
jgi:hypothetical protein